MNVNDEDLIRGLLLRDGVLPTRSTRRHRPSGACRYGESVGDRPCPWCAAEERRLAAEANEAQR